MYLISITFQILYLAWIWAESNEDAPYIRAGHGIFHKQEFIARFFAGLPMLTLYSFFLVNFYSEPGWCIAKIIGTSGIMAIEYWILFEMRLNYAIGENLFYVGGTSRIDKVFKNKPLIFWLLKLFLLILSLTFPFFR